MKSEPYYFIKWKDGVKNINASQTPSAKYLRENVEYACLDDELWELLQDSETRNELRDAIIQHFIKPRT
jgi:putative restriction endonuclease